MRRKNGNGLGTDPPVPSAVWVQYFCANADAETAVTWTAEAARLTADEREAIAASVAEFQLGESSEGSHLLRFGRRYADDSGDSDYFAALRLFISEEHRHARDLGRFMDLAGLPRMRHTWGDSAFRFLRRSAGLEGSIAVLVTAEVIATVYYAALRAATDSPLLRGLCARILADEAKHVQFQCERLAILRERRGRLGVLISVLLQRLLMAGACALVWRGHRRALRRGGYGFIRFWRQSWRELQLAVRTMQPARHRFGPPRVSINEHQWWAPTSDGRALASGDAR